MCSGPFLRKRLGTGKNRQRKMPKRSLNSSDDLKKKIPASSTTPFQTQNFHDQQMSPLQRLSPPA